ncbi:hypothetical protein M413DRAFT_33167 [Hebeloma cylindrosporum]|uniref:Uncharacterized protein n=1 Tax=Hebeloma cylindrosporum TaxID=76867 RepID=A0A0C2Y0I8_HEBCY|nr:hypothetical protein M413DRAFT_33167 [Hebeloma cylindrosporum h7]
MAVLQELPQLEEFPIRTQAYFEDMAQPQVSASGQEETLDQVRSRLTNAADMREKAARRTTRRAARYKRRLEDVQAIIKIKKLERATDLFVWKWLEQLILLLGPWGTSSDDTEYDCKTLAKIYVARELPWRRNVVAPMKRIEDLRKPGGPLERSRGSTAELRVYRKNAVKSSRDPPMERSKDIFSAAWLEENDQKYLLSFSEQKFEFLDYDTFFS